MASQLRKMKRVTEILCAQIAPKNNCYAVGMNLKTEHNEENAVAVGKQTDRISESGSANRKQSYEFFFISSRPRLNRSPLYL